MSDILHDEPITASVEESLRFAVARSPDGARELTLFEGELSCSVFLDQQMAQLLADLLICQ